jgi:hypothetical protein
MRIKHKIKLGVNTYKFIKIDFILLNKLTYKPSSIIWNTQQILKLCSKKIPKAL